MENDLENRLQAALDACARMQDQRDQLAAQLKDATRQCGVMAELLQEVIVRDDFDREDGDSAGRLLYRIDAALAGKLPEQHPDDAAVDRFAIAMKAKLATAREKGRGGWDDPNACSVEFLADLLVGHVGKGNPGNFEDIANLAMMLHQRGADPAVLAGKLPVVPVVPEGWQLVPVELTEEMTDLALTMDKNVTSHSLDQIYRAMLAAAPKPEGKGAA